jgi:D-aminoacyl-tRNA deacylase
VACALIKAICGVGEHVVIGLLQRVSTASVAVDGFRIAEIGRGLLVLAAVLREDTARDAQRLAERILGYRVFPDASGRMNLSLADAGGSLLLVPQFTLAADTRKGMRAGFSGAASPEQGRQLFDHLLRSCERQLGAVASGRFGADMQVSLVNDGPVTFWLET